MLSLCEIILWLILQKLLAQLVSCPSGMLQKTIFVCGLIYPASPLSASGNCFEGKVSDNCRWAASHNAGILNEGFLPLHLMLYYILGKRLATFFLSRNLLIKSLYSAFAKPRSMAHFSTQCLITHFRPCGSCRGTGRGPIQDSL